MLPGLSFRSADHVTANSGLLLNMIDRFTEQLADLANAAWFVSRLRRKRFTDLLDHAKKMFGCTRVLIQQSKELTIKLYRAVVFSRLLFDNLYQSDKDGRPFALIEPGLQMIEERIHEALFVALRHLVPGARQLMMLLESLSLLSIFAPS